MLSTPPAFVLSQDQTLRECLPVIGSTHTRAEPPDGISPAVHSVLAVCAIRATWAGWAFQRNLVTGSVSGRRGINISGVDFWHAVEFSRNGRFLCALSVLINSVPGSPGASLRSCVSDSIRSLRARFSPVRFRLSASSRFQPYQIRFRLWPPVGAGSAASLSLFGLSDSIRSDFVPLPVRIRFRIPVGGGLPWCGYLGCRAFRRVHYFSGIPR